MNTPSYQYQPLEDNDSIRILVLHPSPHESDPIECTICHENLSDGSPEYEAVSYTWGNSGLTHVIHCNDAKQRLSVGQNCYAALRRLRLPEQRRALWIDAVCINQEDLSERGHQVRMMKEVYDYASGVMVMLNDTVPECRLLLEELAELDELLKADGEDFVTRIPHSDSIIRQLETLLEDPWFTRTWVLQEVYEKESIGIMYGSDVIPFDALNRLYVAYEVTRFTLILPPLPFIIMWRSLNEFATSQFLLWNRLWISRECLAANPRDNVFALKSLLGSKQVEMDHLIDYAQSVEECFKRVATFLLPVLGLRILVATRQPHGLDMASWIPDWSQTHPLPFRPFCYETFGWEYPDDVLSPSNIENHARALSSYSYSESQSDPQLHVLGCQLARIVECSPVFQFVDLEDVEMQMLRIYNKLNNLKRYLNEESKIDSDEAPGHFSGKVFHAMSLTDGRYLHSNLARTSGTYRSSEGTAVIQFRNDLSDLYDSLQNCCIALMQNGGLAILPGLAQDGDVVCIIEGAVAPCLLRDREDESWRLVSGDCHVFGDEESSIAVSDAYVNSHRSQARKFVLR